MKITQSWKRNAPSTVQGESITYTIVYSSFKEGEIDRQQEFLEMLVPKGCVQITETGTLHSIAP